MVNFGSNFLVSTVPHILTFTYLIRRVSSLLYKHIIFQYLRKQTSVPTSVVV